MQRVYLSRWLPLVFLFTANILLLAWLSEAALTKYPNTGDEFSIQFQAQIFSRFQIAVAPPPQPVFFDTDYVVVRNGNWFGIYPPFYSIMLAPGAYLGKIQYVTFLLSSTILILLFCLVRSSYDSEILAWLTTISFWLSPTFLFHSASYYNHIGATLVLLLILNLALYISKTEKFNLLWAIGLLLGIGVGIRPYSYCLLAIPICSYIFLTLRKRSNFRPGHFASVFFGASMIIGLLVLHNRFLTGTFFEFPYWEANSSILTIANLCTGSLSRILHMIDGTSKWIFGLGQFASGNLKIETASDTNYSVLLLGLAMIAGLVGSVKGSVREQGLTRLYLALIFILISGHIFYSASGGRFGERFFFEITCFIVLFFSRAIIFMAKILSDGVRDLISSQEDLRFRYLQLFIVIFLTADLSLPKLVKYIPNTIRYYKASNSVRMDPFLKAERLGLSEALIFLQDVPEFNPRFYSRNDPWLRSNVFVRYIAPEVNSLLMRDLPQKKPYVYYFDQGLWQFAIKPL